MRRSSAILVRVLLIGMLVFAGSLEYGCSLSTTEMPNMLNIKRGFVPPYQAVPQFHPTPFQEVVRGQPAIQPLYEVTLALPKFPTNVPQNCGKDYGLHYRLTFLRDSKQLLFADADPFGCPIVTLNGHDLRAPTSAFWQALATALGRPLPDVLPEPTDVIPTASPSAP